MAVSASLFLAAENLTSFSDIKAPEVERLIRCAESVGKSWSGSWLGYHSRVYYKNLNPPPSGAHFSMEWGFLDAFNMGTVGDWHEYEFEYIVEHIYNEVGGLDVLSACGEQAERAEHAIEEVKAEVLSLIYSNYNVDSDKFLSGLVNTVEKTKVFTYADCVEYMRPSGSMMSRDMIALEKGFTTPPHIHVIATAMALKTKISVASDLRKEIIKLASHIKNLEGKQIMTERVGTNVFIGHGRAPAWRELKDFIGDRLGLPWDEFNRVPIAGLHNTARLSQMLDQACIAFLIMTAEDETADRKSVV